MLDYFPKSYPKETLDFIIRVAYLSEIKEWDCRPHIERIRKYSYIIGSGTQIDRQTNEIISMASQLHDIGKAMMPDQLLHDGGIYDDTERPLIERHTIDGAKILEGSSSSVIQIGASIALTHHERWDGSGYPNHLKGEEIPLGGRICAIADVFDALTTARSYKQTISKDEALQLIMDSSGVLFDPALVKAFKELYAEILKI
ncbi:MAG TPA: HD domain-containing phosphohydrolase [Anaerolineales bacterium]|nr:HD domain-containing phosphohydrolase [Anaerolineales bacterium]